MGKGVGAELVKLVPLPSFCKYSWSISYAPCTVQGPFTHECEGAVVSAPPPPHPGEENLPYRVDRAEDRHNTLRPTRAAIEKKTYIREESLASLRRWVEMGWSRVSQARGTV